MKKYTIFLFAAFFALRFYSQSSNYKLITGFEQINNGQLNQYYVALSKIQNEYFLMLKNTIKDFSYKLIDTNGLKMTLRTVKIKKKSEASWTEIDNILLDKRMNPVCLKNEIIIPFVLPDSLAFDLKNQKISEIILEHRNSSNVIPASKNFSNFFVVNNSKINATSGSFAAIDKYNRKAIPFHSLLLKSEKEIQSKIGLNDTFEVVKSGVSTNIGDTIKGYKTESGNYNIFYKAGHSYEIHFQPSERFKYSISYLFDDFPFEIENCNCGEYLTKTDSGDLIHVFSDKPPHRFSIIPNGRFVGLITLTTQR